MLLSISNSTEFQKIHKKILQFGDDCPRVDSLNASCIKITYQLEDKQKITRYYTVRGLDMEEIELKEFLSDTQGILERVFSPAYQEFQYISARVDDKDGNLICEKIYENIQDEKEIEKMYEAVLLDLQEGNIVLGKYRKHALFYVKMDSLFSEELIKKYNLPEEFFNDDFEEESEKRCSVCLPVTKKCTNINKILEAWGISGDYPEVGSTIFLE